MKGKMIYVYRGKKIEKMTKPELIEALKEVGNSLIAERKLHMESLDLMTHINRNLHVLHTVEQPVDDRLNR